MLQVAKLCGLLCCCNRGPAALSTLLVHHLPTHTGMLMCPRGMAGSCQLGLLEVTFPSGC